MTNHNRYEMTNDTENGPKLEQHIVCRLGPGMLHFSFLFIFNYFLFFIFILGTTRLWKL